MMNSTPKSATQTYLASMLTADVILPKTNRFLRTPGFILGLGLVVSAVAGVFLHSRGWTLMAALVAVAVVGCAMPWLSIRAVSASLEFDRRRGREGEPIRAAAIIRRKPFGLAHGFVIRGGLTDDDAVDIALASIGRETCARWEWTPSRRGIYPSNSLRIATGYPFGLREFSRPVDVARPIVVWPATFPLPPLANAEDIRTFRTAAAGQRAGHFEDLTGVRPYRDGEPLRRIHWALTARQDRLMIVERQAPASAPALIVLDTSTTSHRGAGPNGSREWAIRIAASMAANLMEMESPVVAIVAGQCVSIGPDEHGRSRLFDALAAVPDDDSFTLADALDASVWKTFAGERRFIVATDIALASIDGRELSMRSAVVALQSSGFGDAPAVRLSYRPWVVVKNAAEAPREVRHGWETFRAC
jgi:uncharacterized protein (DUF58 family)